MTKSSASAPKRRKLKPKRFTRSSVIKMLTIMSHPDESTPDPIKDFLTTGRVGRRNALPDILSEHAHVSTADLPEKMDQLTTGDDDEDEEERNRQDEAKPSTSQKS
ncbi:cAMP-dependent protein kinase inhibitor [Nesidiocoris tenuis]|uniref:cAMP-dependent protein kinase inhibitor n=1 Tax=Nesidiocoris tenuis TaxID=355587 RepID=A0ABN7AVH7_9HEMI|nr:cAMP-dependent protein kinase inhibitor [Nesidiocoris tenuis]